MALYLISYDLLNHKTFGQYEELIQELERIGAKKVLYSEWVMSNTATSIAIRDHLAKYVHTDDRILVSELSTTNWASRNLL